MSRSLGVVLASPVLWGLFPQPGAARVAEALKNSADSLTTLYHGLLYGAVVTVYLFLFMIMASPRIWGYADYSDAVKRKVPPQTKKEKTAAVPLVVLAAFVAGLASLL